MKELKVLIWNEYEDEKQISETLNVNPGGIHKILEGFLGKEFEVTTKTWYSENNHGLTDEILDETDVLIWYSHWKKDIPNEITEKLISRVFEGMGVIFLHSAIFSDFARLLIGPAGNSAAYREVGELERVWCVNRAHPIVEGLPDSFDIPKSEMYPEPRDIPTPQELIFISWYEGGEILRSGYTYTRGAGKIFCFLTGHSTFPIYQQKEVQQIIINAVNWCAPLKNSPKLSRNGEVGFDYKTYKHN